MTPQVDFLYPFDKGFFGKTLYKMAKENTKDFKPSKITRDSIDDLVEYFDKKLFNYMPKLERSPRVDTVEKRTTVVNQGLSNFWEY